MNIDFPPRNEKKVIHSPVNQCIYCYSKENKLTDEHIIPFSLGGLLILPKASCKACAKITAKFEGVFSRAIFGNLRMRYNLPTRRKKERLKYIEVERIGKFNIRQKIKIPVSEFPAPTFIYKCTKAGILEGKPFTVDNYPNWQPSILCDTNQMDVFQKKYGENITFKFIPYPEEFAKTLAKIAYSYAISYFGVGSFSPLVLDLILGKEKNFSYLVGGDFEIPPPLKDAGHLLSILVEGTFPKVFIIVNIRFFGSASTPDYHVVVGVSEDEITTKKILEMHRKLNQN